MSFDPSHTTDIHDHDRGLAHDLAVIEARLNRRRALGLIGAGAGAAFIAGCGPGDAATSSSGTAASGTVSVTPTPSPTSTPTPTATATSAAGSCTAYATETNGPYPADGTNQSSGATSNILPLTTFQRSDIRSSVLAGSSAVAPGRATQLVLTLADVNATCAPLAGYAVYLWHCDALGRYSLYDLPNESYLRGIQVSDSNGQVTFTTIVPGCYAGRYPHLHFEVFSSLANATTGRYARLVSQIAIPTALASSTYADTKTYGSSLSRFQSTSVNGDNVFGDNTTAQEAAMTLTVDASETLVARATVGIAT